MKGLRSFFYFMARLIGWMEAISSGKIGQRSGRVIKGRFLGKWISKK